MDSAFPEEVLEHVFSFVGSHADRNAISAVCRLWRRIERQSRRRIFVGNIYAVSPTIAIRRFPAARAVELKGKPHFADFNLVPYGWGGGAGAWISAMAEAWPWLEEIRLKRMVVSDESLEVLSRSFRNFRVLVLSSCEGFSTDGLAAVAANCRNLSVLDLRENEVEDRTGHWLNHFPESCTSLVTLNIAHLVSEVSFSAIERLVGRCPNLRTLRLNHSVTLDRLASLLCKAPQLSDIGTGGFSALPAEEVRPELYTKLESAFMGCKCLRSLSGFGDASPVYLSAVYSVCPGLTTLNLSYASLQSPDLVKMISRCPNLQQLWKVEFASSQVMDCIEDEGLEAVAESCRSLKELRVFPSDPYGQGPPVALTERGLVAISVGCPSLHSILYFCRQMTNVALQAVAHSRPNLTCFRLCIIDPRTTDYLTGQPLDTGFSAVVESCQGLRRLSLSGLLTDRVFERIGTLGHRLEMLSVAFAGDSDAGLHFILSGCPSLRKLEIRDCPFGDTALLANAGKLETMRSLWMSSCHVTLGACRALAEKMPRLNVEVIDEGWKPSSKRPDDWFVEKLYVYRTVAGPRLDMPSYVYTLPSQQGS
ncbi:Protein TRANSPORT INHIBITOR RESPONSE 1 [Acorus gramineus]|uniref:Protein TRANSPORT INHIBITOR RESPONSE 1 n=1 Tax=Acorus gramineus TaxID=55184 RepID=A0AAV9BKJ7_ACOGR|nr:Protein TRANSPORT INHIBITOR RESPONSE 1 [Acorus gramineus]